MTDERRRSDRHPWIKMESMVHIKRSLFKKEWIPVVPFDFSRYGMGIQTDEVYDIGGTVVLSLKLETRDAEVTIESFKGIVRYKEKHHSRFNYGVEFVFASISEKIAIEPSLVQIEKTLRRNESIATSQSN